MRNVLSRFFQAGWPGLLLSLLLYLPLSFYQLHLPGLHYDEAFEAVPAVQLLNNQPVTAFRDSAIVINQRRFPLMTQDYIGALNLYGAIPFILLLGPTPAALRSMSIVVGVVTLLATYAVARQLTGRPWVGSLAALLLAVEPTFIFWNRQGVFVTAVTAAIGMAATYAWLRRFQGGGSGWSMAGAFLFGLGLYAKFLFLWLIGALIGATLLLSLPWLQREWATLGQRLRTWLFPEGALVVLALGVGGWPLLVYNWQTGGTFLSISQNAVTSYYGVNNLAVGDNLLTRLGQFGTMLNGGHLWYLGEIFRNPLGPLLFGAVALLTIFYATRSGGEEEASPSPALTTPRFTRRQVALFPLLVIGLVLLASIVTVSALWVTHFAVLMPWPALAIATGIWYSTAPRQRWSRLLRPLLAAAVGLLLVANLVTVVRYQTVLTVSGGLSSHSDAVYDLSDWLQQNAGSRPVVAMDWGLAAPVVYLTNGQVNAIEIFGYQWQAGVQLSDQLTTLVSQQPDAFYLWRTPDEVIFDRSNQFKAIYRAYNLEETIEEAFYERSGRPLLGVTRLVEEGTAANPP
jgi:4-amino-4-deoxy-L-arabinose transferase-like glycosyltransferase